MRLRFQRRTSAGLPPSANSPEARHQGQCCRASLFPGHWQRLAVNHPRGLDYICCNELHADPLGPVTTAGPFSRIDMRLSRRFIPLTHQRAHSPSHTEACNRTDKPRRYLSRYLSAGLLLAASRRALRGRPRSLYDGLSEWASVCLVRRKSLLSAAYRGLLAFRQVVTISTVESGCQDESRPNCAAGRAPFARAGFA